MGMRRLGIGILAGGALFASGFVGVLVLGGAAQAEEGPLGDVIRFAFGGQRFEELLAQKLGITVEQLRAAQTAARDDLLAEAVAAGRLTAEQAEQIKSRQGTFGGMMRGVGPGLHMRGAGGGVHLNLHEIVATTLGITPEQLREEMSQGKSLAQIVTEKGISRDNVKAAIVTAHTTAINQAVANGRLTQEQADRMLQTLESRIDAMLDAIRGIQKHRMGP
jgi:polyhydroxyalkanoate synthesis regulator phasin